MKDLRSRHEPPSPRILDVLSILVIAIAALIAFFPALSGEFLNWGTDYDLQHNSSWRGIDAQHLEWMFSSIREGTYQPLTWLSFGIDARIWRLEASGYHLTNALLHMIAAVLCFRLARRIFRLGTGSTARDCLTLSAAMAALLFAVHPLRVESVAWISQRTDVLGGVFFFGAILSYIRAYEFWAAWFMAGHDPKHPTHPSWGWLLLSYILFCCALLSNNSVLCVPVILLILDICPLHRLGGWNGWFNRKTIWVWTEKLFFSIPAIALSIFLFANQSTAESNSGTPSLDLLNPGILVHNLFMPLWNTLIPLHLSPIPNGSTPSSIGALFWVQILFLIGLTVVFWLFRKRFPALLGALICYIVLLIPALLIDQLNPEVITGSNSYFSCVAWAILAGRGSLSLLRRFYRGELSQYAGLGGIVSGMLLTLLFVFLSNSQSRIWVTPERFWKNELSLNPHIAMPHIKLAEVLSEKEQLQDSIECFRRGLEIAPDNDSAWNGLGIAYSLQQSYKKAIASFEASLTLNPDNASVRSNYASALASIGLLAEAGQQYEIAISQEPQDSQSRVHYAAILCELGQWKDASWLYQEGLQLNRKDVEIASSYAWLLATCPDEKIRNGQLARILINRVIEARGSNHPHILMILAASEAECENWSQAIATSGDALFLARQQNLHSLASRIEFQLSYYKNKKPWRTQSKSVE